MANIDALLSPSGGYDYERTINTGLVGLTLGLTMDKRVYSYLFGKPAVEYFNRYSPNSVNNAFWSRAHRYPDEYPVRPQGMRSADDARSLRNYKDFDPKKFKSYQARTVYDKRRKEFAEVRKVNKKFYSGVTGARSLFRAVGWSMLVSEAFNLAEAAFTPGISKTAARADQEMMAMPLDSQFSFTMRQRGIQAIHDSMMTTRQVVGQEAQFMHR